MAKHDGRLGCGDRRCGDSLPAHAADKFEAPGASAAEPTTVTSRVDGPGKAGKQVFDLLEHGEIACGDVDLDGAVRQRVVHTIVFTSAGFGACVFNGARASITAPGCDVVFTGRGDFELRDHKQARCALTVEGFGCTVTMGPQKFLGAGFSNVGPEMTAITELSGIEGFARGVGCMATGPAFGTYKGNLILSGSRNGEKATIQVIL